MSQPKWVTPNRQAYLVKLFLASQGFCVFGHKPCPYPEHHYEAYIEGLIKDWVADDRAQRQAEQDAESKALHSLGERRCPLRGRFNNISRDIFHARQPQYYIEGVGISGLTLKPFAKVRLASSYMRLHIDLADSLRDTSKNARRKAIRHGKLTDTARQRIDKAVKHYLDN
jgi:hypothetical protein